jgi:hypothetical protein
MQARMAFILYLLVGGCSYSGLAPLDVTHPDKPHVGEVSFTDLKPVLAWESFPRAQDIQKLAGGQPGRITDVRYQVRIWEAPAPEQCDQPLRFDGWVASHPIVAEVRSNQYAVQTPLKPSTRYCWSVRAWFRLDGKLRVTQWSRHEESTLPFTYEVPESLALEFFTKS